MPQPLALKDPKAGSDTSMGTAVATLTIMPQNFGEVIQFADRMAASRFVPAHLRDKPADCLAVCLQALRWGFDPFAVAQKTYFTKDGGPPAYEAQLINAVILARAPLRERPDIEWTGAWPNRKCTVTGWLIGDSKPKVREVLAVNIKTRNSPLWVTDPDQQIAYYTTRAWARLYCPDVLMGVYTPDDDDMRAERARDVTPTAEEAAPRPASKLDAMEAAIAGEPSIDAPTFEADFMPQDAGELGDRQPELGALQQEPAADAEYERANKWGSTAVGRLEAATDVAKINDWLARNKDTIDKLPVDIGTVVYETAARRKATLTRESVS